MTTTYNPTMIQQWINNNLEPEEVRANLKGSGLDDATVETCLQEFKKLKHKKRLTNGFILLGIGSFLGFVSCLLTIINPIPALYYYILYGMTSIAVILIFLGLYFVFE